MRARLSSTTPRARAAQTVALGALLTALVASPGSAQPSLRDEALLASFSPSALDDARRPTFVGDVAITADGRCVTGSDVVLPMAQRYVAWAHPSSASFVSAAEPFRVRTALYRNDCTPTSVLLEDFSGFVSTSVQAPLLASGLVQHADRIDLVPIPAPGGTLTPMLLADAASVAAVLPPIASSTVLRSEVRVGTLDGPAEIDSLVFDAVRTWYEPGGSGETLHEEVWILEVQPGSAPVARLGPFPILGPRPRSLDAPIRLTVTHAPDHLVVETRRELLFAPRDAVALDPAELASRLPREAFRWPSGPSFAGLVPAPSGLVAMFDTATVQELHRVSFDPSLTDLDRDGLVVDDETRLGLSDLDRDSDGDGFDDAVELSLGTDPARATDAPPERPFDPRAQLAPTSYLAMERPGGFGRERCGLGDCWETPGLADIACVREGSGPTEICFGPGDDTSLALGQHALPTLDGRFVVEPAEVATSPSTVRWRVREIATGATRDVTPPAGIAFLERPFALSGSEIYFTVIEPSSGAPVSIVRWLDGVATVVLERTACARFVGERECGIGLVGHDRVTDRPLAVVWSSDGTRVERTWLHRLEASGPRYVGELTQALPSDSTVVAIHSLASGGYVVTSRFVSGLEPPTAARLDPYFRAAGTQTRLLGGGGAPGFGRFRRGHVATDSIIALIVPPASGGSCIEGPGASVCFESTGGGSPTMPFPVSVLFPMEWRTVGDRLEPGELVAFSTSPLVTSYGQNLPRTPTFFRIARDGVISAWIDGARFESLLDADARAALAGVTLFADPHAPVRTLAVSPDRSRLCVADGARTFEIVLSDGVPSRVELADASAGEACAYDASGALAVIAASPHALRSGGTTVSLPDDRPVSSLVRVEDTWILARGGEEAYCVGASVEETTVRAVGVAPALGGVVWLDALGQGHFAPTASRFCEGTPSDRLGREGFDLWAESSAASGVPGLLRVSDVTMTVRGDGRVVAYPRLGEARDAFPLALMVSWFPRWEPVDGAGHRGLDPLRRDYPELADHEGVQVERLADVSAIAYVPGPTLEDDWGYRTRPGRAPPSSTVADAGLPLDGGPGSTPPPPSSTCACAASSPLAQARSGGAALALAALLGLARRRRAARR